MNLMQRRRALMGEPQWELMDFPITNFNIDHTYTKHQYTANGVRVYNTGSYAYSNIRANFTTEDGYEYRYTVDITVNSGAGRIMCRAGSNAVAGTYSATFTSGTNAVDIAFPHNSTITNFTLFCAYATAARGDVTFENFKLYRRRSA